jgi:AcrR family transcriptional regulator
MAISAQPERGPDSLTDPVTEDDVRATDGRVPGRRGIATRRRLLDCTAELLGSTSYRDIKVIDIAREAGTSPATVYQYIPDVEQAVLVLAEELASDAAPIVGVVNGDWRGEKGAVTARAVVESFLDYYERHPAVFRVVDLATGEGDLRFKQLRTRALGGITDALCTVIGEFQHDGKLDADVDPKATAFIMVAMRAHSAAHRYGFEFWGVRTVAQIDTLTRVLAWNVTGRKPRKSG